MKNGMKGLNKRSGYVSPMLVTVEIELEQVIAASHEKPIEPNGGGEWEDGGEIEGDITPWD